MRKAVRVLCPALLAAALVCAPAHAAKTNGWERTETVTSYYKNGKKVTGLVKISGRTYAFDQKGRLKKSAWFRKGSKVYRTNSRGQVFHNRLVEVKGKKYYFGASGARVTGWRTLKGGRAYFGKNGVMYTGVRKIGGGYYYFGSDGYIRTGNFTVGSTTYWVDSSGKIQNMLVTRDGQTTAYDAQKKAMSSSAAEHLKAMVNAQRVVDAVTNSSMSDAQKLRACFDWVVSKPYATLRVFHKTDNWVGLYANDHFERGRGNCQADAAAFAYLAKALGCTEVYVCVDTNDESLLGHSWAEVGGLVYDPLFAESKGYEKNYGVPYGVYSLHAIVKVQIA